MNGEAVTVMVKGHPVILDKEFAEDFDPKLWQIFNPHRPSEPKAVTLTYYIPGSKKKGVSRSKFVTIHCHRIVIGAKKGQMVDHINRNPLDNRRSNLRICSNGQNRQNSKLHRDNKSGFTGVYFTSTMRSKPWRALGRGSGRRDHLGYFETKEQAALAYNVWASKYFGQHARLNDVLVTSGGTY